MIWTTIPAILLTWTNIPVKLLTWTVIPEPTNALFDRSLNWFSISCGNFGLIWLLTCTVNHEWTFEFCNPVTFVWLRNERFPAYVFRDSGCFELSVQLYTCFRGRIWTICFRGFDFAHVSELTSGVSDLLSRWNLNYLLPRLCLRTCFRFIFAAEFELFASEALPSYMFLGRAEFSEKEQ